MPTPPLSRQHLKELYEAGYSLRQIAGRYQTSCSTIRHHLLRAGVPSRSPGRPRSLFPDQETKIVQLYTEERLSGPRIAERYGVSSATIYRVLKKHHIPRRPGSSSLRQFQLDEARALLLEGHAVQYVARATGMSRGSVWRLRQELLAAGLPAQSDYLRGEISAYA